MNLTPVIFNFVLFFVLITAITIYIYKTTLNKILPDFVIVKSKLFITSFLTVILSVIPYILLNIASSFMLQGESANPNWALQVLIWSLILLNWWIGVWGDLFINKVLKLSKEDSKLLVKKSAWRIFIFVILMWIASWAITNLIFPS